jgi:hypothetical protein
MGLARQFNECKIALLAHGPAHLNSVVPQGASMDAKALKPLNR